VPCSFYLHTHHRDQHSFPTRRSSDLSTNQPTKIVTSCSYKFNETQAGDNPLNTEISGRPYEIVHLIQCSEEDRVNGVDGDNLQRSEEHTSELQSRENLVCRLLLEKKK